MSNRDFRDRKRRERFARARCEPAAFAALIASISKSKVCVWRVAQDYAGDDPLTFSERAMIAEIVAPRLAGGTPGKVRRLLDYVSTPEVREVQRRNMIREAIVQTADLKEQMRLYLQKADTSAAEFHLRKREVESGEFDEADAKMMQRLRYGTGPGID